MSARTTWNYVVVGGGGGSSRGRADHRGIMLVVGGDLNSRKRVGHREIMLLVVVVAAAVSARTTEKL